MRKKKNDLEKNHHFGKSNEIMDIRKDHNWVLKALGER